MTARDLLVEKRVSQSPPKLGGDCETRFTPDPGSLGIDYI